MLCRVLLCSLSLCLLVSLTLATNWEYHVVWDGPTGQPDIGTLPAGVVVADVYDGWPGKEIITADHE